MEKQEKYLFTYGYGTTHNGTRLDNGTIERIMTGFDWIKKQEPNSVHVLLGAGKDPNFPNAPMLKSLMCDYICAELKIWGYKKFTSFKNRDYLSKERSIISINLIPEDAWSTWHETRVIVEWLQVQGIKNETIYVVSHKFHQKRIEYIWSFFKGYKMEFIACEDTHKGSDALEPLKMVKVFLLGNMYRLKKFFK
jgi:hypothetical protein